MNRVRNWLAARKAIEIARKTACACCRSAATRSRARCALDAPDAIELDYVRAMMAFLLFRPEPRDVLMVGLGAGSMARFVHARMPGRRVTVSRSNPGVVTVARKYFRFPQRTPACKSSSAKEPKR